jgi:D-serine deaminase-like pyridoxal phosphate-dependent protein
LPTDALDTPVAVVDVDRLERNLERWQRHCDDVGLANRPHIKTHRSVEIARRQRQLGAVGVTCQKLGEAETMVSSGLDDVLVPYNIVGRSKLERLARLLEQATLAVTVDDAELLRGLEWAASEGGRELRVLVECDTGLGRAGVQTPADAAELAWLIGRFPSLRFSGFLTFPTPPGARAFLAEAVEHAERRGLNVTTVSTGGTPTMWSSGELRPVVTEYRAGTYAFHDRNTLSAGAGTLDHVALTVAATVVSRPTPDRALLDAGSKSLSSDRGPDDGFGLIVEAPESAITRLYEEHANVELAPGEELELGQVVHVVPNHACVVANLFDELVATREGEIVERWSVDARGRST